MIKIDKETMKTAATTGIKVGKVILLEGTKAVAMTALGVVMGKFFTDGITGIKEMRLDDYLHKTK